MNIFDEFPAIIADSPEGMVRIVRREDLIRLKRGRNSPQDQVDIGKLTHEED